MAYDILVREAKDLPEDMIEQVIEFMRFLKYASKKEQTKYPINNNITFHRSVNPLADEFIAIAEDFDETPECSMVSRIFKDDFHLPGGEPDSHR